MPESPQDSVLGLVTSRSEIIEGLLRTETPPFRGDERELPRIVRTVAAGGLWASAGLLGSSKSLIFIGESVMRASSQTTDHETIFLNELSRYELMISNEPMNLAVSTERRVRLSTVCCVRTHCSTLAPLSRGLGTSGVLIRCPVRITNGRRNLLAYLVLPFLSTCPSWTLSETRKVGYGHLVRSCAGQDG